MIFTPLNHYEIFCQTQSPLFCVFITIFSFLNTYLSSEGRDAISGLMKLYFLVLEQQIPLVMKHW